MRLVTLGVGAQDSPRFAPAGLLAAHRGVRVMLDGGPGAEPTGALDAWLVSDERAKRIGPIRRLGRERGVEPQAGDFRSGDFEIRCRPVVHTNHPTFGYLIAAFAPPLRVVWAPEFLEFPRWARGASRSGASNPPGGDSIPKAEERPRSLFVPAHRSMYGRSGGSKRRAENAEKR